VLTWRLAPPILVGVFTMLRREGHED